MIHNESLIEDLKKIGDANGMIKIWTDSGKKLITAPPLVQLQKLFFKQVEEVKGVNVP